MDDSKKKDRIDCHVSEDDCLLPEWAKKLKRLVEEVEEERKKSNNV